MREAPALEPSVPPRAISTYAIYNNSGATTADATTSNLSRVCACRQP